MKTITTCQNWSISLLTVKAWRNDKNLTFISSWNLLQSRTKTIVFNLKIERLEFPKMFKKDLDPF